jgi:hypothetical protein
MNLVNTNGLALIGPGSEWFWSALQFVIVAITLYAIYRQVRLQASTAAIEQVASLDRDWRTELMARSRLDVQLAVRDKVDVAKLPRQAVGTISNYWERVGYLVHSGHIDERLIYEYFGNDVRTWWALLAPLVKHDRELYGDPKLGEHFDWLGDRIAAMDREAGFMEPFDDAYLAKVLPTLIENNRGVLRAAEDLRAVIVRPKSTASLTPQASAE